MYVLRQLGVYRNNTFLEFGKYGNVLTSRRGGLCHNLQQGPGGGESLEDLRWRSRASECSVSLLFHTLAEDTNG